MEDLKLFINPDDIDASYIPEQIVHYPIMNTKLEVLIGEESKRIFDYRVVVTNPNAISEIEKNKKNALLQSLQQIIEDTSQSEDEFNSRLEELNQYYTYEWQDIREVRANALVNHYVKELRLPQLFNEGFRDVCNVGEELYQVDIVSGEPVVYKLDPLKVRTYRSGDSPNVEDADVVIIEDYMSPGKVIDTYYSSLSKKDVEYIENGYLTLGENSDDPRMGITSIDQMGEDDSIYLNNGEVFTYNSEGLFGKEYQGYQRRFERELRNRIQ
jgi:hypothetical protein